MPRQWHELSIDFVQTLSKPCFPKMQDTYIAQIYPTYKVEILCIFSLNLETSKQNGCPTNKHHSQANKTVITEPEFAFLLKKLMNCYLMTALCVLNSKHKLENVYAFQQKCLFTNADI